MDSELVQFLKCVKCGTSSYSVSGDRNGASDLKDETLTCQECGHRLMIRNGILHCEPEDDSHRAIWEKIYDSLNDDLDLTIERLEHGFDHIEAMRTYYPILRVMTKVGVHAETSVELGCGSGAFSLVLKKLGIADKVTLIDYSLPSLITARSLFNHFGENCNLVHARLESYPFNDNAFDLSLSGGVGEHFKTPGERKECLRVHVNAGKLAFFQVPVHSVPYWLQRAAFTVLKFGWPFGFEKPFTEPELMTYVKELDTTIIETDYHFFLSRLALTIPRLLQVLPTKNRLWFSRPMRTEIAALLKSSSTTATR